MYRGDTEKKGIFLSCMCLDEKEFLRKVSNSIDKCYQFCGILVTRIDLEYA